MKSFVVSAIALAMFATTQAKASTSSTSASEPAWCNPAKFSQYEVKSPVDTIIRKHVYKIGKLSLAGMGVGYSKATDVEELANDIGQVPLSEKSCTWYFNSGNLDAEKAFTHIYVPAPLFFVPKSSLVKKYSALSSTFDQDSINMVTCAEKYNYVGMGCDGMQHRGPTVFAMFLAYSGCSPKHSAQIVKQIWGSNHVPLENRQAISQQAYNWGTQRAANRAALQAVMSAN